MSESPDGKYILQNDDTGFKVPAKLLAKSNARQTKIKQQRAGSSSDVYDSEEEIITNSSIKNDSIAKKSTEATKPNITSKKFEPKIETPRIDPKITTPSKTALEIDKIRKQREERRNQAAEIKKQKEGLDSVEQEGLSFMKMINTFREDNNLDMAETSFYENYQHPNNSIERIRVCIRKRPLSRKEKESKSFDIVSCREDISNLIVHEPKSKVDMTKDMEHHTFRFDNVFNEFSSNEAIYNETLAPLMGLLEESRGRVSFFAYGQTSSGKTHTVFGSRDGKIPGVYHYASRDIYSILERHPGWTLTGCFYEIYGGKIFDLFQNKKRINLLEDAKGDVNLSGLQEIAIDSFEDVIQLVQYGFQARSTAATSANDESSRSHAVFQLAFRDEQSKSRGKFSLIDLAGSERAADVNHTDRQRKLEGAEINKSLLALKECIRALSKRSAGQHVPFRASKLTQVLKDSFVGDNACTVMVAAISPDSSSCDHTLNTLRYADRVKSMKVSSSTSKVGSSTNLHVESGLKLLRDSSFKLSENSLDKQGWNVNFIPAPIKSADEADIDRLHSNMGNKSPSLADLHRAANAIMFSHEELIDYYTEFLYEMQAMEQSEFAILEDKSLLTDCDAFVEIVENISNNKLVLLTNLIDKIRHFKNHLQKIDNVKQIKGNI